MIIARKIFFPIFWGPPAPRLLRLQCMFYITLQKYINANAFKLSFKYLHVYSQKVAILERETSKIASLMTIFNLP